MRYENGETPRASGVDEPASHREPAFERDSIPPGAVDPAIDSARHHDRPRARSYDGDGDVLGNLARSSASATVDFAHRAIGFVGTLAAFARHLARYRKFFAATAGLGITALLVVVSIVTWHALHLPTPTLAELRRQSNSVHIVDARGRTIARRGELHTFVTLDEVPDHLVSAVLATEDRRFNRHIGVDVIGLARAMYRNIRAGRYVQGGSTITQQLAKNVFLKPNRTISRKIQELILAFWLESRLTKRQILELYLNRVYFGAGAHGIEAASKRYFGKPTHALTIGESAVLAGLLKAPSRFSPQRDPARTLRRARVVLANMIATGALTPARARAVMRTPIHFVTSRPRKRMRDANYAIDFIYEELAAKLDNPSGDLVVHTTIDRDLQVHAQRTVRNRLGIDALSRKASAAAVVLLDQNGGIKALVGGRSYADSQFNRATKARRQPGSAFKPFVYAAALEAGFTPDTIAYDEPITVKNWTPRNYGNRHVGAVTLRDALARSINTVAVRIYLEVGRSEVVSMAERLGIRSRLHTLPSLPLGTAEVTPLELAGAYVPFSNGGFRSTPHVISKITTVDGPLLYHQPEPEEKPTITPRVVAAMNDVMSATMTSGTGRRATIPAHPSAGKTGTTQDSKDAWFVGYTAHLTAAVWVGNDQAQSMVDVTGSGLPAQIWREVMVRAHDRIDPVPLPGSYAAERRKLGPAVSDAFVAEVPTPNAATSGRGLMARVFGYDANATQQAATPRARPRRPKRRKDLRPDAPGWRNVFSRN